ncbi:ABC transporter ATP-binding protein/permease [Chitinophagales bacterium]|nr:ABC transporter ATP-binding protein/permease [Chitinophagales bacterium]
MSSKRVVTITMARRGSTATEDVQKGKLDKQGLKEFSQIFSYILPYKGMYALSILFLFLSTLTALSFPALVGPVLDAGTEGASTGFLSRIIPSSVNWNLGDLMWIFSGILILQAIFSFFKVLTNTIVTEKALADVRKDIFSALISQPLRFFEQNRVGGLISRITGDVAQLHEVFSWSLGEFLRQIATLIIGSTLIAFINWKLALIMLGSFPIMIVGAIIFGKYIKRLSKATQEELANTSVTVDESLHNISVVKAFTNESFEQKRYFGGISEVVDLAIKAGLYRAVFSAFIILALFGSIFLVFYAGVRLVQDGGMTVGDLLSFIMFTVYIGASVGGLGDIYGRLQKAVGATERVREILGYDRELSIQERYTGAKLEGNIQFQNIDFSYPTRPDFQTLSNFSLGIESGQQIALVGASGAGKSTVGRLLLNYYKLNDKQLFVDGKDINAIPLHQLRASIGVVPQEVILFGGTIRENIAYGKIDATEAEITEAAEKANAMEFISQFPEGMETVVGDRGIKLSGGQKQRVAIARAILKDPSILILDEATSSLDSQSEKLVQDALFKLMRNRTSIVIAHRLSTIREADLIVVMEQGAVVEQGSHDELISRDNSSYKKYLQMQQSSNSDVAIL